MLKFILTNLTQIVNKFYENTFAMSKKRIYYKNNNNKIIYAHT